MGIRSPFSGEVGCEFESWVLDAEAVDEEGSGSVMPVSVDRFSGSWPFSEIDSCVSVLVVRLS